MELDKIYKRAKFAREAAGLSIGQVSTLTQFRTKWLDLFEAGETMSEPEQLRQLASVYRVSLDWLMFGICRKLTEPEEAILKRLNSRKDREHMRTLLESLPGEAAPNEAEELRPIIG